MFVNNLRRSAVIFLQSELHKVCCNGMVIMASFLSRAVRAYMPLIFELDSVYTIEEMERTKIGYLILFKMRLLFYSLDYTSFGVVFMANVCNAKYQPLINDKAYPTFIRNIAEEYIW